MPATQLAEAATGMILLPRGALDAYLEVAKISKKENRVMFIATDTPHSVHDGVAIDWNDSFIRLRNIYGVEVTVALTPGVYVGLTNTKLAKTA